MHVETLKFLVRFAVDKFALGEDFLLVFKPLLPVSF